MVGLAPFCLFSWQIRPECLFFCPKDNGFEFPGGAQAQHRGRGWEGRRSGEPSTGTAARAGFASRPLPGGLFPCVPFSEQCLVPDFLAAGASPMLWVLVWCEHPSALPLCAERAVGKDGCGAGRPQSSAWKELREPPAALFREVKASGRGKQGKRPHPPYLGLRKKGFPAAGSQHNLPLLLPIRGQPLRDSKLPKLPSWSPRATASFSAQTRPGRRVPAPFVLRRELLSHACILLSAAQGL